MQRIAAVAAAAAAAAAPEPATAAEPVRSRRMMLAAYLLLLCKGSSPRLEVHDEYEQAREHHTKPHFADFSESCWTRPG